MVAPAPLARTILVAEDDEGARTMVSRYLEGKGFRVIAVEDGQAAVDALAASSSGGGNPAIDLVLLDVMMPRLTGFEVLAAVRARGDVTPIIMATALANPQDIVRALEGGADDYVAKPYSLQVLAARIDLRLRLRSPAPAAPPPPPVVPPPFSAEMTFELAPDAILEEDGTLDTPVIASSGPASPITGSGERGLMARLRSAAQKLRRQAATPAPSLATGSMVADRYLVGGRLGEGGFGAVFRARHVDLGQDVAIKVLHAQGARAVEAFRREAQNACRVRHENAVRVFDFGLLPGGSAYLVMELLDGPTLEELAREWGPMPVGRAAPIVRNVLAALGAAHKQGLVHRDVKPGNVVLHKEDDEREVPKLLDFGIAKDLEDGSETGNAVVGSAAFIAPERLRGDVYDGRADVYASGIMLFRLLTGVLPFDIPLDDFENVALWHLNTVAPPPSSKLEGIGPRVDQVLARLLDKDPARRPTAVEAEALLEGLIWE